MSNVLDLKTFVSQTLIQIVEGVKEASETLDNGRDIINPAVGSMAHSIQPGMFEGRHDEIGSMINFDVAITAADSTVTKGGVGVFVAAIGLGASGESGSQQQSVSRVQFGVPVILPK